MDIKTGHKIFKCLTDDELTLLNKNNSIVVYNAGEIIFKQSSPITHIAIVTRGLVKTYLEGVSKKNLIIQYSGKGNFFGEPGAFTDNIHHFTAIAVEETSACLIGVEVFKKLMRMNNEFAMEYIEDMSDKSIKNFERFISLTQKQMYGRVAEALIYYSEKVYYSRKDAFPLNRQDLAEITALSKDSAGRILNAFQKSKVIKILNNSIKILDKDSLEEISNKG